MFCSRNVQFIYSNVTVSERIQYCINAKICVFLELENKIINVMIIIKTSKVMIKIFLMNINGASLLGDNKTYVIPKKTERISIHVSTVFV